MLTALYDFTIRWANHPKAIFILAIISLAESSFLPIYPDIILAPMSLAKPKLAWRYALIATIFSVIGGILGYLLGFFLFESIGYNLLIKLNYLETYNTVLSWFTRWGVGAILIAGATPVPYKIFTIASGVFKFNLFSFILASMVGRGARFFLISGLIRFKKLYNKKACE